MTKAQAVYEKINALIEGGTSRADAFKQVAEETGRTPHGVRGSYYSYARGEVGNGKTRTRRRETTLDTAVADARVSLERAIQAVDVEVEAAKARAQEAKAEYEDIRGSAEQRKAAIAERLEALK
jgi:hypothetical protein